MAPRLRLFFLRVHRSAWDVVEFATQPEHGPEPALDRIVQSVRSLLAQQGFGEEQIAAIGVSCGSPLDRVKGIVHAPP